MQIEKCLINNKVCSNYKKVCKKCKLDDCKRTIDMIKTKEEREDKFKRECIEVQLPEQCKNCSFLEFIDLNKQIVRCSYRVKDKCILKE